MKVIMNRTKKIIIAIVVTVLLVVSLIGFFVWYNFFDVTGLELYSDQPISNFFSAEMRVYLLTEEGYGYVAGGYLYGDTREYLNSENVHNSYLNGASPVKFYNGKIKQIIDEEHCTMFITEKNELFELNRDLSSDYIASDVVNACGTENGEIYYITSDNSLYKKDSSNEINFVKENIKKVKCYKEFVYVLSCDNVLYRYEKGNKDQLINQERLLESVKTFEVVDTSERLIDGKYIDDNEQALSLPLINVLTGDGNVYVRGAYNVLSCGHRGALPPAPPMVYEEWTLIGTEIKQFSLAPMGTIMLKSNGTVIYYGFDSDLTYKSRFGERTLNVPSCELVGIAKMCIWAKDKNGTFYFWGEKMRTPFFYPDESDHSIMYGTPFQLFPKE